MSLVGIYLSSGYSRSSRRRPPLEFRKVVATRAGREWTLVSDHAHDETIESGRLQELLAESLACVNGY